MELNMYEQNFRHTNFRLVLFKTKYKVKKKFINICGSIKVSYRTTKSNIAIKNTKASRQLSLHNSHIL